MLQRLERTYLALFREYPGLVQIAIITGAAQAAFALLNIYALPVYLVHDLGLSGKALGATASTFLVFETLFKFPMGRLSDHRGRRPFALLGPLLISLNPLLVAALPARLWMLIFPLRAADGAGGAALWPPLFALIGDLVHTRSRAAAMAVIATVYGGASAVGVLLGAVAARLTGSDRAPFCIASALFMMAAATAYFGLPRPRRRDAAQVAPTARASPFEEEERGGGELAPPCTLTGPTEAARPLPDRERSRSTAYPLTLVMLISLLMVMAGMTLASFLILYVRQLPLSRLDLIVLVICVGGPAALLALPLGHLADRWGRRIAVQVALGALALLMWLMPWCRSAAPLGVVSGLLVLSVILGIPAWLAIVTDLAPTSRRGGIMGLVTTAEGIGAGLGPLLGGWLWDMRPPYIFYGAAALLSICAVVAAVTLRDRKSPGAAVS